MSYRGAPLLKNVYTHKTNNINFHRNFRWFPHRIPRMQSHHIPNHTVPLLSHTESQPLIQTSNNFYTITHTNILHTKSHRNIPLLSFTKLQSQMYHTPNHSEIHSYSHTQNQTNTHKRTKHQITQKYTLIPTQNHKHTHTDRNFVPRGQN